MTKFATSEGTQKFFRFHEVHSDKKRVFDDLSISAISLGTHLGDSDERTDDFYESAIALAVSNGINHIDTAINYRNQRSERLIGRVLKELNNLGITRDQLILSSKGGILPTEDGIENFESYIRSRYLQKEIMAKSDIIHDMHCLTPRFIEAEIHHSLENMGIDCLDLYYLHNPEIELKEIPENAFDEKMYQVFEMLEKMVSENKIRRYGLSTWNGFRQKIGSKGLLDLSKFILFAENIAGENHHFKAIQLPFNFVMTEGMKVKNQEEADEKKTVIDLAGSKNIAIFTSSPFMQSQIFKMPERIFTALPSEVTSVIKALQFITSQNNITSTIIGMKNASHVHENIKVLQKPNWDEEAKKQAAEVLGI